MLVQVMKNPNNVIISKLLIAYRMYKQWGDEDNELIILYTKPCELIARKLFDKVRGYKVLLKRVTDDCDWLISKYNERRTVRVIDEYGSLYSKIDYYFRFRSNNDRKLAQDS